MTNCLIYLGFLRRFQHSTGHITTGSWKGRGNQYIEFARVLYCKLPTNGKQLPAFPLQAMTGIEPWPQRWEARVLPLCHRGPVKLFEERQVSYASMQERTIPVISSYSIFFVVPPPLPYHYNRWFSSTDAVISPLHISTEI